MRKDSSGNPVEPMDDLKTTNYQELLKSNQKNPSPT